MGRLGGGALVGRSGRRDLGGDEWEGRPGLGGDNKLGMRVEAWEGMPGRGCLGGEGLGRGGMGREV